MAREFVMGAKMTLKDRFSKQLKDVKRATDMFSNSIEGANSETAEMVNRQLRARDSMDDFSRDTQRATNNLKEQRTATNRLGSGMRMLRGLLVGVASSMALVGGKKWLVDSNANMETYQNTLEVIMGSQEEAIKQLEWAEKFAGGTPFQIGDIVEATTRLESYGLQSEKVLGITGDMASVMGKDLMQAVEAVADAQTGEVERLKEFGITKDMIEEQAEMLGTNPINNKGQITDMKAFNAALFSLMEERFEGGMAMQMETWDGMMSNAKDFWSRLGRTLGEPIFEEAKLQLEGLLEYLSFLEDSGAIDRWATNVENSLTAVKNGINNYIKPGVFFMIGAAQAIRNNWDWIGPFVEGLVVTLGSYLMITKGIAFYQTVAAGIQWAYNAAITAYQTLGLIAIGITEGWAGVQTALNIALNANPIGLVVASIALLVGGLILAYRKSETFRNIVNSVWDTIWTKVKPIVDSLRNSIVNAFSAVLNWVNTYWPKIEQIISFVWAFLGPFVMAKINIIKTAVINGFSLIFDTVRRVMGMVGAIVRISWSIISGIFGVGLSLLTGDWEGAWEAMLSMLSGIWTGIEQFFTELGGLFLDAGGTIINTLVTGIQTAAMAPVEAVKNVFEKVRNLLPFSDAKDGPFSNLTGSGQAIITTIIDGIENKATKIYDTVTNVFEKVKDFALTPINGILNAVDNVFSGVRNSVLDIYNKVVGIIDKIPKAFLPKNLENLKPIELKASASGDQFKDSPTTGNSQKINPAGTVNTNNTSKSVAIQNLIGTLELKDVGNRNVEDLVDEIIASLYNRLSDADEVLSTGEMEVLLNG